MQLKDPVKSSIRGKNRFIVEMQGGGETSNTGKLTSQVEAWSNLSSRTNADLTRPVKDVGTLETNAWRRQQEQLLVKGSSAKATGECGMALCIGQALYDYITKKIGAAKLQLYRNNPPQVAWSLAVIPIIEVVKTDPEGISVGDSLSLKPDKANTLYMDYDIFVGLLVAQGGDSGAAFSGNCLDLDGTLVQL